MSVLQEGFGSAFRQAPVIVSLVVVGSILIGAALGYWIIGPAISG